MNNFLQDKVLLNFCCFIEILSNKIKKLLPFEPYSPFDIIESLKLEYIDKISEDIIKWLLVNITIKSRNMKKQIKNCDINELHNLFFDECHIRRNTFILYCDKDKEFEDMMNKFFEKNYGKNNNNNNNYEDSDLETENSNIFHNFNKYPIPFNEIEWKDLSVSYKVCLLYN